MRKSAYEWWQSGKGPIAMLKEQVRQHQARQELVLNALPEAVRPYCKVLTWDLGILQLAVANQSIAQLLKMKKMALASSLRQQPGFHGLVAVKIITRADLFVDVR